jgi:hypothetical protein
MHLDAKRMHRSNLTDLLLAILFIASLVLIWLWTHDVGNGSAIPRGAECSMWTATAN